MENITIIVQGGIKVTAKDNAIVTIPVAGERYREHKVQFSDNDFTVLNSGESNYLPISWAYSSAGGSQKFTVQHTYDPANIEVYRIMPDETSENVLVTIDPDYLYIEKQGFGNDFVDVSFMVRVLITDPGEFL